MSEEASLAKNFHFLKNKTLYKKNIPINAAEKLRHLKEYHKKYAVNFATIFRIAKAFKKFHGISRLVTHNSY